MNKITYWIYEMEDLKESAIKMRDISAVNYEMRKLKEKRYFKSQVFGYNYDCLNLVKDIIGCEYYGTILEVGAGTGIASCHLSKYKKVEKIFTLEYSKVGVENLIPFVIKLLNLTDVEENKIFPVVGSFNNIKLPDNSVDFVISILSLHHSENREKTLKEIFRVLKVGGYLIAIDKASFNFFTNKMLNDRLDVEYDDTIKKEMGYDVNSKYTRRMNSEHEPILAEWQYLLAKCGFKSKIFWFTLFGGKIRVFWNIFGKLFFKIFGKKMIKRSHTQFEHILIPYYPWFTKNFHRIKANVLIVSQKEPYFEMP